MTTINNLSIEQMREIVNGAPEGATHCYCHGKSFDYRVDYYKYFFNYLQMWLSDHGWFPVHEDMFEDTILINDLRTAIAKHDTTDHVTDIRNHLSPSTIVKDLEAERHG